MHWKKSFCVFLSLVVAGCAGLGGHGVGPDTYTRTFPTPFDEVWDTTVKMLEDRQVGLEEADKGRGRIVTQWLYRESERRMGVLRRDYWKERHRLTLRIKDRGQETEVMVYGIAEEKRPGGTQAYRWERIQSSGDLEMEVLDAIGRAVAFATKRGVREVR